MRTRRIYRNKPQVKKEKNKNTIFISLIILLLIIISISGIFIFKNNTQNILSKNEFKEDQYFKYNINGENKDFFTLIFTLNKDNILTKNIKVYQNQLDKIYEIPVDRFVIYDDKYYQLNNIINVIKQNRSESANNNFIYFIQDLIGIKIDGYIYNYENNSNIFYTNNSKTDWGKYISSSLDVEKLDKDKFIISEENNIKVFDQDYSDSIIQKDNSLYRNTKVELYNSTDITGHGNKFARLLNNSGFSVVRVLNYDKVYPKTTVYSSNGPSDDLNVLMDVLNSTELKTEIPGDINTVADYVVILGGDSIILF